MLEKITFLKFSKTGNNGENKRIAEQIKKAGFSGEITVYNLGFDSEDSISLIIEGIYKGEKCCWAVGYGMNRFNLAFRKTWTRHNPSENKKHTD